MPDLAKDLSPVIEALSKKFGVGRDFVACYLKYLLRESKLKADDLRRPDSMPLPWSMWIQYALSTNSRGLSMYHNLKPHLSRGASRHLDIGAGFGGCVHAFTESGFDSVGIEIDPSRVEFSQANLSELGKEGQIHSLDILSNEVFELGAFDVITCTDVIEHVLDPELAL